MTLRGALRVVAWNAALILAVLIAAEAVFGGWFHGGGLGVLHIPHDVSLRHDVSHIRPNGGVVSYTRDHWGFRGTMRDPSQIDILAVGGSTTNELYDDDSQTWTAVLQRRFSEAGRHVIVANAGVDGQSTVGHLADLEEWFPRVPRLHPKLILYYVGINDVYVEDQARYDVIVPKSLWARIQHYISDNSALYSVFRMVRGMIVARRARVVYANAPPKLVPVPAVVTVRRAAWAGRLAAYADRLRKIAALTRRFGARPVFITQRRGDAFVIDGRMMATGPAAVNARAEQGFFNDVTLAVCRETGSICIDLASEIDLAPSDFVDSIHTNPNGSRKIGDYLYRKLKGIPDIGG